MRIYARVACSVWSRGSWLGGALVSAQCCVAFSHMSLVWRFSFFSPYQSIFFLLLTSPVWRLVNVMFLVLLLYFSPYQSFGWCKAIIPQLWWWAFFTLLLFLVLFCFALFVLFGLLLFLFAGLVLRCFYSAWWWPPWTVYWSSFSTASCGPSFQTKMDEFRCNN